MKKCHQCGQVWKGEPGTQPGRNETCSMCGADLHACLNCSLYDPSASNQCRSRTTELVKDKGARNFCDEFQFALKGAGEAPPGNPFSNKDEMDQKWNQFFK